MIIKFKFQLISLIVINKLLAENMSTLINKIIINTPVFEEPKTSKLFKQFNSLKVKQFFNKEQCIAILKWKSPRPLRHYKKNSSKDFEKITRLAFKQTDEKLKIHILTALSGVKYPSASAILMFYDKNYPVLDIRVWRQLYKLKYVKTNPKGTNFSLDDWYKYLNIIRLIAKEYNTTARVIEKKLFDYDKNNQKGNLYNS